MRIFEDSPRVNGDNRSNFFSSAIDNGLKIYRPIYRTAIFWLSTKCRPITDWYIGQVSTNYRRSVGERKAISAETHLKLLSIVSRPSVDRLSTDHRLPYRPTVDRVSTVSIVCRPSVDRVSTECRAVYRPLYRPISQSTLPTVHKIPMILVEL